MVAAQQTTTVQRESPMLQAALAYAQQRGWHAFPLLPNLKKPFKDTRGYLDATNDAPLIRALWTRWPSANIGIATGASGLVVIDEDLYEGADLSDWMLPPTLTAQSARGGQHRFFSYAGATLPSVKQGKLGQGICIKADGGYVVAAPSRFQGGLYRWLDPHQPVAELPERIAERIRNAGRPPTASPPTAPRKRVVSSAASNDDPGARWLDWAMQKTGAGVGDPVGYELAQQLLIEERNGAHVDVRGVLHAYARDATLDPHDPFDGRSVERWISSAQKSDLVQRGEPARSMRSMRSMRPAPAPDHGKKARESDTKAPKSAKKTPVIEKSGTEPPRVVTDAPEGVTDAPKFEHRTDMGNARRFVARFGADARYVALWKQWLIWDGKRWRMDETDTAFRLAKETVRGIYAEAAACKEDGDRQELVKWAMKSESDSRIRAMLAQAQSEPEIALAPSAFDTHPWLFNVQNGTLDLKTGSLLPHAREEYLTQLSPVTYSPNARYERWERYLESALGGDKELIAFLQRAVGYTLTGDTSEEKMFFLHGETRTGKSTFIEAIKGMLGDYARTADFETFIAKKGASGPRDDIADLVGSRLVCSVEVDDGKKLAEGLVKTLTGGDEVKARHLYSRGFTFRPQFKLWLAANDQPRVDATDGAMWTRILRIPFDHPPEKKDKTLKPALRNPTIGGTAILAWAVQGCLAWQRDGLGVPPAIVQATEEYRTSMDPLADFIQDRCVMGPNYWVTVADLWQAYQQWVTDSRERFPVTNRRFNASVKAQTCNQIAICNQVVKKVHGVATRCWSGITLRSSIKEEEEVTVTPLFL